MIGASEVPGGALNLISISYPDHGHHGRLPLSRKNAVLKDVGNKIYSE